MLCSESDLFLISCHTLKALLKTRLGRCCYYSLVGLHCADKTPYMTKQTLAKSTKFMLLADDWLNIKRPIHTSQYPCLEQSQGIIPSRQRLHDPGFCRLLQIECMPRERTELTYSLGSGFRQGLRLGASASSTARHARHSFSSSQILLENPSASPLQGCRSLIAAMLNICARGHGLGVHLCICALIAREPYPALPT